MGKRLFWFGVGIGVTALLVLKGKEIFEKYTPKAIADRASNMQRELSMRASDFISTMKSAMDEREAELRELMEIED
ncbi:MAG: hypothetical protein FWG47_00850 [Propionibacteriaceae bacterium]|nr:hypothetical protein [Propionibacteriaceae bacterium]